MVRAAVTARAKNIVTARETAAAPVICIVTAREAARGMEVAMVHARVEAVAVAVVADVIDNGRRDTDDISSS